MSLAPGEGLGGFRYLIEAMEKVHGTPPLPAVVPVTLDASLPQSELAKFRNSKEGWLEIAINPAAPHWELPALIVHESGHLIDALLARFAGYASEKAHDYDDWRNAVQSTHSIKTLQELYGKEFINHPHFAFKGKPFEIKHELVRYLLRYREIFARSYVQYIAIRSRNPDLNSWLDIERNTPLYAIYPVQWNDKDFRPVAEALDDLFEKQQWQRK